MPHFASLAACLTAHHPPCGGLAARSAPAPISKLFAGVPGSDLRGRQRSTTCAAEAAHAISPTTCIAARVAQVKKQGGSNAEATEIDKP